MPERRAVFQTSRRTSSTASIAHRTTRTVSMRSVAFLARPPTTALRHVAPPDVRNLVRAGGASPLQKTSHAM
ncbi:MAG TPA: hypothetical protein VMV02_08520 [Acidimicrobiales bacterium]|nr:hypothetical protein [Acidimicrobiales bacterium]